MTHVAILGAGITGAATALYLARGGRRVTLFDQAAAPLSGASRWNEGKLHLGYLYANDPSLATAVRVLPGGLAFRPLIEELVGCSITPAISERDDIFAIHQASVVAPEAAAAYYEAVTDLVASHPDAACYPGNGAVRPRRLTRAAMEQAYATEHIAAAFTVPERSVSTRWIADRLVDALAAEPRVEPRMGVRVRGVKPIRSSPDGPLSVDTDDGLDGPFDAVVNALWEGRLAVDATMGVAPPPTWSHRFRLSAFVRTSRASAVPSTVIATGPFGDVKNYTGRDLYLSWYPAGLLTDSTDLAPPPAPSLDGPARCRLLAGILDRLGALVHEVRALPPMLESTTIGGGWVFAAGRGSLADPRSTLHRRDDVGIRRAGAYISVDTGKYSIAPWLARQVAQLIA